MIDPERVYALRGMAKPEQAQAFLEIWTATPGKDELSKLFSLAALMGRRAAGLESSAPDAYDREYRDLLADLASCLKRAGGKVQRAGLENKLYSAWAQEFERARRVP